MNKKEVAEVRTGVLRELFLELKRQEAVERLERNYDREAKYSFAAYCVHEKLDKDAR